MTSAISQPWIKLFSMAELEIQNKEYSSAYNHLTELSQQYKFKSHVQYLFGVCLLQLAGRDQALESFQKSIILDANNWKAWKQLGLIQLDLNRLSFAKASLARYLRKHPSDLGVIRPLVENLSVKHSYKHR